jgi:hypothetical protein
VSVWCPSGRFGEYGNGKLTRFRVSIDLSHFGESVVSIMLCSACCEMYLYLTISCACSIQSYLFNEVPIAFDAFQQ